MCGILVPSPGIQPVPPGVEARSLNHEPPGNSQDEETFIPIWRPFRRPWTWWRGCWEYKGHKEWHQWLLRSGEEWHQLVTPIPSAALGIKDPNPRILTLRLQALGKSNVLKEVKNQAESVALGESSELGGPSCSGWVAENAVRSDQLSKLRAQWVYTRPSLPAGSRAVGEGVTGTWHSNEGVTMASLLQLSAQPPSTGSALGIYSWSCEM